MPLLLIRAADGAAFSLYKPDLENLNSLDDLYHHVLSPLLDIPPEWIICMNEEGAPLRDDTVAHLAMFAGSPSASLTSFVGTTATSPGSRSHHQQLSQNPAAASLRRKGGEPGDRIREMEKRLYVFDREHLEVDLELVAQSLVITEEQLLTEPALAPQDPLISHVALSQHNLSSLLAILTSISHQRSSLALALSNLNRLMVGTSNSLTTFFEKTEPNLGKWTTLLEGVEGSMGAIGKVAIASELLMKPGHTREVSTASTTGGEAVKERTLGNFVNRDKMMAIMDGCAKTLSEVKSRMDGLRSLLDEVMVGANEVQAEFEVTSRDLEDLDACENDAAEAHLRIQELVKAGEELTDPALLSDCFEELSHIDNEQRERIRFLVQRKNAMTRYLIKTMQFISSLQSNIASMPSDLALLDHELGLKTDQFKHLDRLEGLIPAYIATVVEVVRRREFMRLLAQHATNLSPPVSHLSVLERSRRTAYRAHFGGKLPWEIRGLGPNVETVPEIDFDLKFGDELPEVGRENLVVLQNSFEKLLASEPGDLERPLRKAQTMLSELIAGLDVLEKEFEAAAQGQTSSVNLAEATATDSSELQKRILILEETNENLERQLQAERSGREEEIAQLNQKNGELLAARELDESMLIEMRNQVVSLEKEAKVYEVDKSRYQQERASWEKERRDTKMVLDQAVLRATQAEDATRLSSTRADDFEQQLQSSRAASEDLHRQLVEVEAQRTILHSNYSNLERELSRAHSTVDELETRMRAFEADQRTLTATIADKDRALRDQRSDSELERAMLERQATEMRTALRGKETEMQSVATQGAELEAVIEGLRRGIRERDEELELAQDALEVARKEKEGSLSTVGGELAKTILIARGALKVAGEIRDENRKLATALSVPTSVSKGDSSGDNTDQAKGVAALEDSTAPPVASTPPRVKLDYASAELETLLADIQQGDGDALSTTIQAKITELTTSAKKWCKEAKAYRERAHRSAAAASDKIAFRNFTKGDLALFLPTRNSTVPSVWAAFNVSFPHHFLSATGVVSEQIKSREWIVARITSLTEKVVDAKDPLSNPFSLAPGTKFFLLEVEPWSSKDSSSSRARRHSSVKVDRRLRTQSESAMFSGPLDESTVLVESTVTPSGRRTVSSSGILPSNATDLARSEFAIVEEEPSIPQGSPSTLRQPVPLSDEPFDRRASSPSALSRSLAHSNATASQIASDPFTPGSYAPDLTMQLQHGRNTPPSISYTSFQPSTAAAFLPSAKVGSSTGSASGSNPRYIRGSSRSAATPPPGGDLASSPTSTSGSHSGFARSPSSASSILSSSTRRRFSGGNWSKEVAPTSPLAEKAQPTLEEQNGTSRWNSFAEQLDKGKGKGNSKTKGKEAELRSSSGTMTLGRSSKLSSSSSATNLTRMGGFSPGSFFTPPGAGATEDKDKDKTVAWGASQILSKLQSPPPA